VCDRERGCRELVGEMEWVYVRIRGIEHQLLFLIFIQDYSYNY